MKNHNFPKSKVAEKLEKKTWEIKQH